MVNFDAIERKVFESARVAINSELVKLKNEIDINTPIDEWDLINDTTIFEADIVWNQIIGSVFNNNDHATYVEYGVQGRTYNYHKQKRIFYVWVGARMFTRAYDKLKNSIVGSLKKSLNI